MSEVRIDRRLAEIIRRDAGTPVLRTWFDAVRDGLECKGVVRFRLSELALDEERSYEVAVGIAHGLGRSLRQADSLEDLRLEVGETQRTAVPAGRGARTLLPHNDGGHCSYLTPSRLDAPGWREEARRYAERGHSERSTATHKLYAGIFVCHPGESLSVTTFYPLLPIVARGYRIRYGRAAGSVGELATFLGRNLLASLGRRGEGGSAYPSLAGILGCSEPMFEQVAPHTAEGDLPPEAYACVPELSSFTCSCPCGLCAGPAQRLFCRSLVASVRETWPTFCRLFERRRRTRRFDFLFWNNLRFLHGGLQGGPSRVLQPIALVVDRPAGAAYEAWLARCWRPPAKWPSFPRPRPSSIC